MPYAESQMTGARDVDATVEGPQAPDRPNYAGAIYGSLLAASVVVGAGVGAEGNYHLWPLRLAALLVATGLVFCLAHAYAELVGDRIHHARSAGRRSAGSRATSGHSSRRRCRRRARPCSSACSAASERRPPGRRSRWRSSHRSAWATFATRRSGASAPLVLATDPGQPGAGVC